MLRHTSNQKNKNRMQLGILVLVNLACASIAIARPYSYPQTRYIGAASEGMGGITLPLAEELGNSLFNNPAGLARNKMFRAEYLNLNFEAGSGILPNGATGLGPMAGNLNADPGTIQGVGFSNLTAMAWGGLGVGLLIQEHGRAKSDGSTLTYETLSQLIPIVGYGLPLARGVIRLGFSSQYINQASGSSTAAGNKTASFLNALSEGRGLSHNASVNFVFPYTYLPSLSFMARNVGGLHFVSGTFFPRAKTTVGVPQDEPMTFDFGFSEMVRMSAEFKTYWYFQYKDFTGASGAPIMHRLNFGTEFRLTEAFGFRLGFTAFDFSAGISYRSKASEINVSWYSEPTSIGGSDTRYALQYKVFFQDENKRDPEDDKKAKN